MCSSSASSRVCVPGVSPSPLGLGRLTPADWEKLARFAQGCGWLFQGYSGRYRYICLNNAEISFGFVPDSPDETPETASRLAGCDLNAVSNTFFSFRVDSAPEISEASPLSRCAFLRLPRGRKSLPVHIMHSDVLPSLFPGDAVVLQTVLLADTARYAPLSSFPEIRGPADCELLPLQEMPEPPSGVPDPEKKIFVRGRVASTCLREPDDTLFGPGETLVQAVIQTAHGSLTVTHPLSLVEPEGRQFVHYGSAAVFTGRLSADAAVGEYQEGAVYDLEHDLRLLRESLSTGNFARAKNIFAENARFLSQRSAQGEFFLHGTVRAEGREAVAASLKALAGNLLGLRDGMTVAYAKTVLKEEKPGHHAGDEKCLIFHVEKDRQMYAALFADTDDEGKILTVRAETSSGCLFLPTESFESWR